MPGAGREHSYRGRMGLQQICPSDSVTVPSARERPSYCQRITRAPDAGPRPLQRTESCPLYTLAPPPETVAQARRFMQRLCERELKLATAESCTGGLAAALLTDIDGCSHAFDRALVAYTDTAKTELLGVHPALLREHGAVSRPVALAMADGALARSGADIAVAVTGFAGPTPAEGEEGRVHFALARTGERTRPTERAFGPLGRDRIREACLTTMLGLLEDALTCR